MRALTLGSTSVYRRALLTRLGVPFEACGSEVDETPLPGEKPQERAVRLARAKALTVAAGRRGVVIGSDQVASLDGALLRKPHTRDKAVLQLSASSGRQVDFHTAVCIIDADDGSEHALLDHTVVRFRALADDEIARYLDLEQPYDCAGSFKCESAGISLFEAIISRDPTALIGLPLIGVAAVLRGLGWRLP
jgi:septum formation protein